MEIGSIVVVVGHDGEFGEHLVGTGVWVQNPAGLPGEERNKVVNNQSPCSYLGEQYNNKKKNLISSFAKTFESAFVKVFYL